MAFGRRHGSTPLMPSTAWKHVWGGNPAAGRIRRAAWALPAPQACSGREALHHRRRTPSRETSRAASGTASADDRRLGPRAGLRGSTPTKEPRPCSCSAAPLPMAPPPPTCDGRRDTLPLRLRTRPLSSRARRCPWCALSCPLANFEAPSQSVMPDLRCAAARRAICAAVRRDVGWGFPLSHGAQLI